MKIPKFLHNLLQWAEEREREIGKVGKVGILL